MNSQTRLFNVRVCEKSEQSIPTANYKLLTNKNTVNPVILLRPSQSDAKNMTLHRSMFRMQCELVDYFLTMLTLPNTQFYPLISTGI